MHWYATAYYCMAFLLTDQTLSLNAVAFDLLLRANIGPWVARSKDGRNLRASKKNALQATGKTLQILGHCAAISITILGGHS